MNTVLKAGSYFGTSLNLHISWLWILPLTAYILTYYDVAKWPEAVAVSLLIFGSVLMSALAQLWVAHHVGLRWRQMTLFLLGGIVERTKRSNPHQEMRVAGAGVLAYLIVGLTSLTLWLALPSDPVRAELQTVALFNAIMVLFTIMIRLTPHYDNVLHATLASLLDKPWPHNIMTLIHSIVLPFFAITSLILLAIGWVAFVCWAALACILSQLTSTAELYGEYQEELEMASSSMKAKKSFHADLFSNARYTQPNKITE